MRKARTIFTEDEIKAMEEVVAQGYLKFGDVMDIEALKWSQSVIKPERRVQHMNRVTTEIIKAARSKAGYPPRHSAAADKKMRASPPPCAETQTEMALVTPAETPVAPSATEAGTPAPDEKESKKLVWVVDEGVTAYERAFDCFNRHPGITIEKAAAYAQLVFPKSRRKEKLEGVLLRIVSRAKAASDLYRSRVLEPDDMRQFFAGGSIPAPAPAVPVVLPPAAPLPADPAPAQDSSEKGLVTRAVEKVLAVKLPEFEASVWQKIDAEVASRVEEQIAQARAYMLADVESAARAALAEALK